MATSWQTQISYANEDDIVIRGHSLVGLIGEVSFAQTLHLLITGELPSPAVGKLIDAILVSAIDHGAGTPSVLTARTAISGGASVKNGATAGLLALDRFHGAAVEDCMLILRSLMDNTDQMASGEAENFVAKFVQAEKVARRKIPGFGHRQHLNDPRLNKLFSLAEEAKVEGRYLGLAIEISRNLSDLAGKPIPVNVDGAIAAILCELNYPQSLGNAPFLISRLASLLVHSAEEFETQPRMRRIDPVAIEYSGKPLDKSL